MHLPPGLEWQIAPLPIEAHKSQWMDRRNLRNDFSPLLTTFTMAESRERELLLRLLCGSGSFRVDCLSPIR
jgi:hypothetical protein